MLTKIKDKKKTTKKENTKLDLPDAPTEALTIEAKQKIYNEVEDYYFEIFKNSGQESDTGFQNEKITLDEKNQLNKYLGRLGLDPIKSTNTKWKSVFQNLIEGQNLLSFNKRLAALMKGDSIEEVRDASSSKPRALQPMIRNQYPSGGPKGSSLQF